jgi:hypothetical protein
MGKMLQRSEFFQDSGSRSGDEPLILLFLESRSSHYKIPFWSRVVGRLESLSDELQTFHAFFKLLSKDINDFAFTGLDIGRERHAGLQ